MPHQDMTTVGGRELIFETGELASQANGSVLVTYGETVVLVTAVASQAPRGGVDFFPPTVGVEEKVYAAGGNPRGVPQRRRGAPGRALPGSPPTHPPPPPPLPQG